MRLSFNPFGEIRTNRAIGAVKKQPRDRVEKGPMQTRDRLRRHITQIDNQLLIAVDGIPNAVDQSDGTTDGLFKVGCEFGGVNDCNLHLIFGLDFLDMVWLKSFP